MPFAGICEESRSSFDLCVLQNVSGDCWLSATRQCVELFRSAFLEYYFQVDTYSVSSKCEKDYCTLV